VYRDTNSVLSVQLLFGASVAAVAACGDTLMIGVMLNVTRA